MKRRWKLILPLGVTGAIAVGAFLLARSENSFQKALTETRAQLQAEGYKIDMSEFDLSTGAEVQARQAALYEAFGSREPYEPRLRRMELMTLVGDNSAVVLSKADFSGNAGEDLWPVLRDFVNDNRARFDAAAQAALSGPIAFNLKPSRTNGLRLPHLAQLKNAPQTFAQRAILDLRDGKQLAAYTNVLAATRLATAWRREPLEISYLLSFVLANDAFHLGWQFLQAGGSTETELATMQREWENWETFSGIPATAAFSRASTTASCQAERNLPLTFDLPLKEALQSPRSVWPAIVDYAKRRHYRHAGTYEDEKDLLLYWRDREIELKTVVQKSNWLEMGNLPGVTAVPAFASKYTGQNKALMNLRPLRMPSSGGWLRRAGEAEAERRLIITAIALERFHLQHHAYPETLEPLVPDYLKAVPIDFMDGKSLRYHPAADGQFTLYSVGPDGVDNNGKAPSQNKRNSPYSRGERSVAEADIIWPRPASAQEIARAQAAEAEAQRAHLSEWYDAAAERDWARAAHAQEQVEEILHTGPTAKRPEGILLHGQRIEEALRLKNSPTNHLATIDELFTLKQIITGSEPEVVTFELPIDYSVARNLDLFLLIDPLKNERYQMNWRVPAVRCLPGTNGNCLLVWQTVFDSPGKHALQAELVVNNGNGIIEPIEITGPLLSFFSSNVCQFSLSSAEIEPTLGITMYARLPESNGVYSVEFQSTKGEHRHTVSGRTSNGVIKVNWDLKDDSGHKWKEDTFNSIFTITLPDSGRTGVQRCSTTTASPFRVSQ